MPHSGCIIMQCYSHIPSPGLTFYQQCIIRGVFSLAYCAYIPLPSCSLHLLFEQYASTEAHSVNKHYDRNLPYRRQSKHRPEASSSGHTEETEERGVEVIGKKKCGKSHWTQSAVLHMYSISSQGLFLHYITAVTQSPALQWRLLFLTVWGNLGITGTIPLWFSFSAGKFTLLPFNYRRINSKPNHESQEKL